MLHLWFDYFEPNAFLPKKYPYSVAKDLFSHALQRQLPISYSRHFYPTRIFQRVSFAWICRLMGVAACSRFMRRREKIWQPSHHTLTAPHTASVTKARPMLRFTPRHFSVKINTKTIIAWHPLITWAYANRRKRAQHVPRSEPADVEGQAETVSTTLLLLRYSTAASLRLSGFFGFRVFHWKCPSFGHY